MYIRITRRRIARGLLGALLFVQVALAMACDWQSANAAQAVAAQATAPSCHDAPALNTNLCLTHCLGADQTSTDHEVAVPAWAPGAVLAVLPLEPVAMRSPGLAFVLPRAGAPPPRILLHSFLI